MLVTGAAGALGRAVVDHFADQGAPYRAARRDRTRQRPLQHHLRSDRRRRLRRPPSPQSVEHSARSRCWPTSPAASTMGEAVHETSAETWDFLMGLNADSVLNMARAVVPGMLECRRRKDHQHRRRRRPAWRREHGRVQRFQERGHPIDRSHVRRTQRVGYQRELYFTEHHRHRAESSRHAGCGLLEVGNPRRTWPQSSVSWRPERQIPFTARRCR